MRETPGEYNATAPARRYPVDNLAGFRWHTGAPLRPLAADEPCPVLFRDLGPLAMARFLRGELRRLAGPLSPIIYLRTEEYVEPYTDYERIGRLLFLRPLALGPWHSGVPTIYVARATPSTAPGKREETSLQRERRVLSSFARAAGSPAGIPWGWEDIAFVPGDMPLAEAAQRARDLPDALAWREELGGRLYDEAGAALLASLDALNADLERTEQRAAPLRALLQSPDPHPREQARRQMERAGIDESDLCTAWHHLPRQRRAAVREGLQGIELRIC
jgi:hypothetical protein